MGRRLPIWFLAWAYEYGRRLKLVWYFNKTEILGGGLVLAGLILYDVCV